MNYPDYDTLREQYEAGNFPQSEEAAKSFLDFREALFEECISN